MRKQMFAWLTALLLLMGLGAGTAVADEPTQAAGQESSSQQSASSGASATQVKPTNRNVDVRIFSPGDNGAVTQTNAADATAIAGNANKTDQAASQDQSGAGTQAVGQDAASKQSAEAGAAAEQIKPTNSNVSVRIDSPGDNGDVQQTNAAAALAVAGNANKTDQSASQDQSGAGTQAVGQDASNKQSAAAGAEAVQIKPTNSNVSVRIDSPGDNGAVEQTNAAAAEAIAGNLNKTDQAADQSQGGGDAKCGCGGGDGVQAIGQSADSHQSAGAAAQAVQLAPSNDNTSVRIGSPGHDGSVSQSNLALAGALAGNVNGTSQSAAQSQGGGSGVQAIGQKAGNWQDAYAESAAVQIKPSNTNTPVSIGDGGHDKCGCGGKHDKQDEHGGGSGGDVSQSNVAASLGIAFNANHTDQSAAQSQGGGDMKCGCYGGSGVQAAGQKAWNGQDADAAALAFQLGAANENTTGGSGSVRQTNAALALSLAANLNKTRQEVAQAQH